MRKKTKLLSALLALVMVLSIAVMAFAANECGHDDDTTEEECTYLYLDNTYHDKIVTVYRTCNVCFEQTSYVKSRVTVAHAGTVYRYVEDYSEDGEDIYVYDRYCVCGDYIDTIHTTTRHH